MAPGRPTASPIPRRIAPLAWRRPVVVWIPLALALALGWPSLALYQEAGLGEAVLIAGAAAAALGLTGLGLAWAFKRPPRTRREAIPYLLLPGCAAALATPFVLNWVLSAANQEELPFSLAASAAPLALLIGFPAALFSALVFSIVALVKPQRS